MPTLYQLTKAGQSLNEGGRLSNELAEKIYKMTISDSDGAQLKEMQCYNQLMERCERIMNKTLVNAAQSINVAIANALYRERNQ